MRIILTLISGFLVLYIAILIYENAVLSWSNDTLFLNTMEEHKLVKSCKGRTK